MNKFNSLLGSILLFCAVLLAFAGVIWDYAQAAEESGGGNACTQGGCVGLGEPCSVYPSPGTNCTQEAPIPRP